MSSGFGPWRPAPAQHDDRLTAWRGVRLYGWNGSRLVENWVEQDYAGRDRQLTTGVPNPLDGPHLDPWVTTRAVPEDADAVEATRRFLLAGDLAAAGSHVVIDDRDTTSAVQQVVDVERVTINDLFSAGARVAVHVALHGPYTGGLAGVDPALTGSAVDLHVAGVATVDGSAVRDLQAVDGKLGIA